MPFDTTSQATTTPDSAAIDPTERSISAVMITIVIPTLTIPIIAMCLRILVRFAWLAKLGAWDVKTTKSTA